MKGELIKQGRGMPCMLDYCYRHGLTDENSILVVTDYGKDTWELYKKVTDGKEEQL